MNYLVYLGLMKYDDAETRRAFARKSYELFLKEWKENGHVHENYNAVLGTGDDVKNQVIASTIGARCSATSSTSNQNVPIRSKLGYKIDR